MWTSLTADEQAQLAERIRVGDPAAEDTFVRTFGERIRLMILVRIRDAEAARELTQDAMLAAWRAVREERLRDPARLAAFVHGTTRNIVNNYIRVRASEPPFQPLTDEADRLPAPDESVDAERHTLVARALERLSADDRQVLLLTLVRGLPPRQIAASLGLSADVVRARKSRAVKRVIEAMAALSRMTQEGH